MAKTKDDFDAMRRVIAAERAVAGHKVEDALQLTWWFIENVSFDDPDRDDIFFELRAIVREAWD